MTFIKSGALDQEEAALRMTPHSRWGFVSGLLSISPLVGMEIIAHTLTHTDTQKKTRLLCACLILTGFGGMRGFYRCLFKNKSVKLFQFCVYMLQCVLPVRERKQKG